MRVFASLISFAEVRLAGVGDNFQAVKAFFVALVLKLERNFRGVFLALIIGEFCILNCFENTGSPLCFCLFCLLPFQLSPTYQKE